MYHIVLRELMGYLLWEPWMPPLGTTRSHRRTQLVRLTASLVVSGLGMYSTAFVWVALSDGCYYSVRFWLSFNFSQPVWCSLNLCLSEQCRRKSGQFFVLISLRETTANQCPHVWSCWIREDLAIPTAQLIEHHDYRTILDSLLMRLRRALDRYWLKKVPLLSESVKTSEIHV